MANRHMFALFLLFTAEVAFCADTSEERSWTAFGAVFTVGDSLQVDNTGYGAVIRTFTLFDPAKPSGFYYGFGAQVIAHNAGGVILGDVKITTLGYRLELLSGRVGFDASLSPVLGSRTEANIVLGSAYLGFCPAAGFFFTVAPWLDMELSYEPVINLFSFNGPDDAPNLSYNDISLYFVIKRHNESRKLDW